MGRVDTKVRYEYLFSGYRFPNAGGGAVVWRGSRPRRLGAPFSIQPCQLESKKKGFGCLGEKRYGKMDDSALCKDPIPKKQLGSADLEVKLLIGFILPGCSDAQMPRCPKCPDDLMGVQDRGTGEDTLPSRLPRSILDLSHIHLPPSAVPSARAAVMQRLDGYDLMMTMG